MSTVEIWYDFGSPASYLGYWQVKKVAERTGAKYVEAYERLTGRQLG